MAPIRIMIIDDDEDDIDLLIEALQELDPVVSCETAKNGHEGLTKLNSQGEFPQFIFLDLNMPGMNGKDCLVEVKKIPGASEIPVIIYTTSRQLTDINETRRLGASYFLTKPTRFDDLLEALSCILFSKSQEDEAMDSILITL